MTDYSGNKPGDLFATIDEAARDAAIYMGEESFENGWEYAVAVYSKKRHQFSAKWVVDTYTVFGYEFHLTYPVFKIEITIEYTYTEISTSQDPNYVTPPAPMFGKTLAIVHTHPMGSGSGITRFSNYYEDKEGDIPLANALGILMYVYGPNGEMRKYDPATGKDILLYTDLPHSPYTPWLE
jgi:hypothetical protein